MSTAPVWQPPRVHSYGGRFAPTEIPPRQWLLGHRRAVAEVTADIGPPGVNKSTLLLNDAVAIVTGRPLLADKPHLTGDVLVFAGEDSQRDVEAKLAGILTHYRIQPAELGDRLHVVYLAEVNPRSYSLAQMMESVAVVNHELLEWVRTFPKLVAAFIDPIAAWHSVLENDTGAMKVLCTELRRTAVTGGIHIGFDHHITKATMSDPEGHVGNLAAARGAYITSDARWAFTLAKLRQSTADEFGIPKHEQSRWRRLDPLKASYGPDDAETRLLKVESITIANGEDVAVLSEVNARQIRADAFERKASEQAEQTQALTRALTAMLEEDAPRSAEGAAAWIQSRHPELFPGRGHPLSTKTIRERLPGLIGRGLNTMHKGRPDRIVCRVSGTGKGARREITFAQMDLA
jgi:RecA-family ATPase